VPLSETEGLCRQRRNLAGTLSDNDDVIRTLETLMGIFMHVLALFAYMAIFGMNVQHLLISLSSISVASAFVFGNSLRTLYESVVFLFVIRPYQVPTPMLLYSGACTVQDVSEVEAELLWML
jgi:mechanosensitive ion channel protein 4/5/6/7/8/9/10